MSYIQEKIVLAEVLDKVPIRDIQLSPLHRSIGCLLF